MTNNRITIVPAAADAQDKLALIGAATFLESFAGVIAGEALLNHCKVQHSPETYAHLLAQGAKAWSAELEGAPVGYALICEPDLDAARTGDIELKRIYLLSKFHGSGIASELFDAVWSGVQKHARLLLGVKADNERAIAFYTKLGFEKIAVRKFNVGGRLYDDLVLARSIQSEQ